MYVSVSNGQLRCQACEKASERLENKRTVDVNVWASEMYSTSPVQSPILL